MRANGTDYGLIDAQTHQRSPAYYAMALWSRFGDELVQVEADAGLGGLGLYGGRSADGSARLLVVNPSRLRFGATIAVEPAASSRGRDGRRDCRGVAALDKRHLERVGDTEHRPHRARRALPVTASGELRHDFPAYSITLLSWEAQTES